jgi:ribA/ribD-fused uncharacterized protein
VSVVPAAFGFEPYLFDRGWPSNFHVAPIEMYVPFMQKDYVFPTNEHYFQAMKIGICNGGTREMFYDIQQASTAMEAKRLGRQVPLDQEELIMWDTTDAVCAMVECNMAKYTQHEHLRQLLVETAPRPIVEHRPDPIWGDNMDGSGRNLLGKTLELVRAAVR